VKILYIVNLGQFEVHKHIIDNLIFNGISVYVEEAGDYQSEKFGNVEFQNKHKKEGYDWIISNTHSRYPKVRAFERNVKPKVGFIDLEHDIFYDIPENSIRHGKNYFLAFQNKHYKYGNHIGFKTIKCRWPKLDMSYEDLQFKEIDKENDAIIIGDKLFGGLVTSKKPLQVGGFRQLWYKPFASEPIKNIPIAYFKPVVNAKLLPSQFIGPKGVKYCADASKFIIAAESGCLLEALLFGSLPIMTFHGIVETRKFCNILSIVEIPTRPRIGKFKAITVENLEWKVAELRKSDKLFKEIHKELFLEWFDEDYFEKPKVKDVILQIIKGEI